jgi:peptidoglycan/LPS O-acetylase OafA/YrhL
LVALCILLPGVFGDEAPGYARSVLRWRVLSWIGLVSYAV